MLVDFDTLSVGRGDTDAAIAQDLLYDEASRHPEVDRVPVKRCVMKLDSPDRATCLNASGARAAPPPEGELDNVDEHEETKATNENSCAA